MEKQEKKPFYKKWKVWFVIVLIVLVSGTALNIIGSNSEKKIQNPPELSSIVKQIIISYLKSPGSAQFVELIVKKEINTENKFVAFGDVDSQNEFGGLMRSHFFLELINKGGDVQDINNWEVYQLDLGNFSIIFNGKTYDTPLSLSDLSEESRLAQKQLEDIYRKLK